MAYYFRSATINLELDAVHFCQSIYGNLSSSELDFIHID